MGDGAAPATLCKKSPRRKRKRNEVGVRTSYHAVLPSPLSIFPLSCFFFFFYFRVAVLPQTYRDDKKGHLRNHFYVFVSPALMMKRLSTLRGHTFFLFILLDRRSYPVPYWTSRGIPIRYLPNARSVQS